MYCKNCGQRLEDGTKFCGNCGAKVILPLKPGSDLEQTNIPEEDSPVPGDLKKKKKPDGLNVAIIFLFAVLVIVVGFKAFGGAGGSYRTKKTDPETEILAEGQEAQKEMPKEVREEVSEEIRKETMGEVVKESPMESSPVATEMAKESEKPSEPVTESVAEETESEELRGLEGALAASSRDLYSEADFITAFRPDGAYSFLYPTEYFYKASYNERTKDYYLETADGSVTVSFYEMDSPVIGDPYASSDEIYGVLKGDFLEGVECPYVHQSKGVADDGYSRMIIGGPLAEDPSLAVYYCIASNNTSSYAMQVVYPTANHIGIGVDFTQIGYLVDCLYRGWSLSGSTYAVRTYEQYLADDMGSKKPGES